MLSLDVSATSSWLLSEKWLVSAALLMPSRPKLLTSWPAFLPHKKGFAGYSTRFVDPALGFALGMSQGH
jgi:hypothetical protein